MKGDDQLILMAAFKPSSIYFATMCKLYFRIYNHLTLNLNIFYEYKYFELN